MTEFIARLRGRLFCLTSRVLQRKIRVGKGLKIYKRLSVRGKGEIRIGKNCTVGGIPGDRCQYVSLDTHSEEAVIIIGDNASLYAARISAKFSIKAGDDLHMEESGIIDTDFHSIDETRGTPLDETFDKCRIDIGDRVGIGSKSFITKGVTIGDDVKIWPGSIVTSSVKSGASVCGNPARPVR